MSSPPTAPQSPISNSPRFTPRPPQARILEYVGGPMGVSAVPGSGKTFTLSLLAADLVERLARDQTPARYGDREVLVVTFTNSAVENFRSRIGSFLRQRGLLAGVGYRVRTLHGLAHDIVRERPSLVGLSEQFEIVDERTASTIKDDAVNAYLRANPDIFGVYILPEFLQNFRRIERYVQQDALEIANAVIRIAKENRLEPHDLQARLRDQAGTWPLLDFGLRIYADYQRSLYVRGAVDFDDLIVLALRALDADSGFCERLQERWPYVLEDEAQDSSLLQEEMLRVLTQSHGNWVRVGDPNQAINTTFTSADPRFLRAFIERHIDQSRDLPNSGRSAPPIIDAANFLIDWSQRQHPVLAGADGEEGHVLDEPHIQPTPPGDPQPNPEPGDPAIYVFDRELDPNAETNVVMTSLARWLPEHADWTVAVLVPENNRGFSVANSLEAAKIPYDDTLLRSDSATRAAAKALSIVLSYITQPHIPAGLQRLWEEVWWPRLGMGGSGGAGGQGSGEAGEPTSDAQSPITNSQLLITDLPEPVETFGRALSKLREPESFVYPDATGEGRDWVDSLNWLDEAEGLRALVERFRGDLQRWTAATVLPVDELLLTLGNDLFDEPADLALTHRLAVLLAKLANENPAWRLPELAGELENIAANKRRILGFSDEGLGFEPKPGQVTLATMHAAKGLEWDRVYLMAVNNFSFPSGSGDAAYGDKYRGERWYVRDGLNLTAETIAQTEALVRGSLDDYRPGPATEQARRAVAAERLRLLYVGLTRARRELILTYNTGRNPERDPNEPALAFTALKGFVARS